MPFLSPPLIRYHSSTHSLRLLFTFSLSPRVFIFLLVFFPGVRRVQMGGREGREKRTRDPRTATREAGRRHRVRTHATPPHVTSHPQKREASMGPLWSPGQCHERRGLFASRIELGAKRRAVSSPGSSEVTAPVRAPALRTTLRSA